MPVKDSNKKIIARVIGWFGVATAMGLFTYSTLEYDPNALHFAPPWVSFAFIAAGFVSLMAFQAAGRLKVTDVVLRTSFELGFKAGAEYNKAQHSSDDDE